MNLCLTRADIAGRQRAMWRQDGAESIATNVSSAEALLVKLRRRLDVPVSWEQKRHLIEVLVAGVRDQAVETLRLTSRARELFLQQPAAEQRRLLRVIVEKAAWPGRRVANDPVQTVRDLAPFEPGKL